MPRDHDYEKSLMRIRGPALKGRVEVTRMDFETKLMSSRKTRCVLSSTCGVSSNLNSQL
jgi:hypothetical protein